jgi:hypothetical protein
MHFIQFLKSARLKTLQQATGNALAEPVQHIDGAIVFGRSTYERTPVDRFPQLIPGPPEADTLPAHPVRSR